MHRSLLLLLTGLLAVAAPSSAMYVEGYVRDSWHDVRFEVRETADGIELVLVEGNFSEVQASDHINYTVVNTLPTDLEFILESTQHSDDPVDDQGNVQKSTRPLEVILVPSGMEVTDSIVLFNDSFAMRFTAVAGEDRDEVDAELLNMYVLAASGGMVEDDGDLDDSMEEQDEDAGKATGIPATPLALLAVSLLGLAFLARRN